MQKKAEEMVSRDHDCSGNTALHLTTINGMNSLDSTSLLAFTFTYVKADLMVIVTAMLELKMGNAS